MAKKFLLDYAKQNDFIELELFDTSNPADQEYVQAFEIRSVPTFIVQYGDKNLGFLGTPTSSKLDELIRLSKQ